MKLVVFSLIGFVLAMVMYSCQGEGEIEFRRYYSSGQLLYQTRCQNCHGADGHGLAALIPPLTDTSFLNKNKNKLACYIQNGLKTPISVAGKTYIGEMPPANLAPMEIAQVITYIRNSFGNKSQLYVVKQAEDDLKHCD